MPGSSTSMITRSGLIRGRAAIAASAVAQTAVAADLRQALDVLGDLAPEVAFDRQLLVDRVTKLRHFVLGEVADVGVG